MLIYRDLSSRNKMLLFTLTNEDISINTHLTNILSRLYLIKNIKTFKKMVTKQFDKLKKFNNPAY